MKDKLIFLSAITDTHQLILKVLDNNTGILIEEGLEIDLTGTVCRRVDFANGKPLIFEDISKESCLDDVRDALKEANVNSYVGVPIILHDGQVFGTLCAVHPAASIIDDKSVSMFQRISKMFTFYLELERMAYRDALTGIYNRQYLASYFNDLSSDGALFFLDLDGFKKVNDLHGHETGDLVLKEAAHRLQAYMKSHGGIAARLGGDEFVLQFNETDQGLLSDYAAEVIEKLSVWNIQLEGSALSVSIGITTYSAEHCNNLTMLLNHADNALYRAKALGKKTYQFY